jgi:hypothetical protein
LKILFLVFSFPLSLSKKKIIIIIIIIIYYGKYKNTKIFIMEMVR